MLPVPAVSVELISLRVPDNGVISEVILSTTENPAQLQKLQSHKITRDSRISQFTLLTRQVDWHHASRAKRLTLPERRLNAQM